MKRLIFTFVVCCVFTDIASSQISITPLSQFQGDTLSYMKYNYSVETIEKFNGKTIGDILYASDIKFNSVKFSYDKYRNITGVNLYYNTIERLENMPAKQSYYAVNVSLKEPIRPDKHETLYRRFYSDVKKYYPLTKENESLLAVLKIKSAGYAEMVIRRT